MRSIKVIAMVRAGDQNRGLLLSEGWRRDGTVRLALVMWHRVGGSWDSVSWEFCGRDQAFHKVMARAGAV